MPQFSEEEMMKDLEAADASGDYELANHIAGQIRQFKSQAQPEYTPENPSLGTTLGRLGSGAMDILSTASEQAQETYNNPRLANVPEPMRVPTAAARGLSEGVFKGAEVASEALGDFASLATPDELETAVVQNTQDFMNAVGDTETAKTVMNALAEGLDYLETWATENPRNGVIYENLKALGATKLANLAKNARMMTGEGITKAGGSLVQSGKRLAGSQPFERAKELLTPKDWRQKENYEVTGMFDSIVWSPTKEQKEMISYVSEIDAFDPSRIAAYNAKSLEEHLGKKAEDLTKRLGNMNLPKVDVIGFRDELRDVTQDYLDSAVFRASGFSRARAEAFVEIADDILSKTDGSVVSLHNARKAIDRSMKKAMNTDDLTNGGEAFKSEIMAIIRNGVNSKIFNVVPNETAIKKDLRRQFLTYRAMDILDDKARSEAATVVGRAVGRIEDMTGLKLPSTLLGIGLTASAAGAVVAPLSPASVLFTMGATGGAYLGNKLLKQPQGRKAVGSMINYLGKAIKSKSGKLADPVLLNEAVQLRDELVEQYEYLYGESEKESK